MDNSMPCVGSFDRINKFFACGLLLCFVLGCGDRGGLTVYPVSGKVTYKNQPLDNATINFIIAGKEDEPSWIIGIGTTDKDGKYTIQTQIDPTLQPLNGAVAGKHQVSIHKFIPPKGMTEADMQKMIAEETRIMQEAGVVPPDKITPSRVSMLPAKYQNPTASELTAVVEKGGKNNFDFDLK